MEASTNGVLLPDSTPLSTTIVRRPSSIPLVESDDKSSVVEVDWILSPIHQIPKVDVAQQRRYEVQTAPVCVHSFVKAVARIPKVKCVIVEDGEGHTVHITTFVEHPTDEIRNEIYTVEVETIRENPNLVFDFHVRHAEEVSGSPASISGKHYYAIWGDLDALRS